MTEVVIPKLGMTMTEGTIVEWTVADGATVAVNDVIFVLSTDKLDVEIEAEVAGVLTHGAKAGECHPCATVVGWIGAPTNTASTNGGAHPAGASSGANASNGTGRVVATPYARRLARERGRDLRGISGTGPGGRIVAADVPTELMASAPTVSKLPAGGATPVARRAAEQLGVDLTALVGTGPGGRITKEDVELAAGPAPAPGAPPPTTPAVGELVPIRGMRKVIADRMHASLREMAQLTLGMDVDMTEAAALRQRLVEAWEPIGIRVSFTDLVGRAAVRALAAHPALNASIEGEAIRLHPHVHLGLAVAVPAGLLVPVVAHADGRSLSELSAESARLAGACRDGTLGVDDMSGATFTVTALGGSGIDFFTPVVNPPNVAILGIGRVHDGVAWDGDVPVRRQVMTLSLTIDHRAIDGAPGAAFLGAVRELLESPHRLLS